MRACPIISTRTRTLWVFTYVVLVTCSCIRVGARASTTLFTCSSHTYMDTNDQHRMFTINKLLIYGCVAICNIIGHARNNM